MNLDVTRGLLNREKAFYEESTITTKATPDSDDIALKKQLPLRQQISRPTLKNNASNSLKEEHNLICTQNNNGKIITPCQILNCENGDTSKQTLSETQTLQRSKRTSSFLNPFSKPVSAIDVQNILSDNNSNYSTSVPLYTSPAVPQQNFKRNLFLRPANSNKEKNLEGFDAPDGGKLQLQNVSQKVGQTSPIDKKYLNKQVLETMFYFASSIPLNALELQIQHPDAIHQMQQPHNNSYLASSMPLQTKEDCKPSSLVFKPHDINYADIQKMAEIPCEKSSGGKPITDSNVDSFHSSHHENIKAITGKSLIQKSTAGVNKEEMNLKSVTDAVEKIEKFYLLEKDNKHLIAVEKKYLTTSSAHNQLLSERPIVSSHKHLRPTVDSIPQQVSFLSKDLVSIHQTTFSNESNANHNESYSFYSQQAKSHLKDKDHLTKMAAKLTSQDDFLYNDQQLKLLQDQLKSKNDTVQQQIKQRSTYVQHSRPSSRESTSFYPPHAKSVTNDYAHYSLGKKNNTEIQVPMVMNYREQNASMQQQTKISSKMINTNIQNIKQPVTETKINPTYNQIEAKLVKKDLNIMAPQDQKFSRYDNQLKSQDLSTKVTPPQSDINPQQFVSRTHFLKLAQEQQKTVDQTQSEEFKKLKRFSIIKQKSFPNAEEDCMNKDNESTEGRPVSARTILEESKNIIDNKNNQVQSDNEEVNSNYGTDSEADNASEFSPSEERQLGDGESSDEDGEEEALESYYEANSSDAGSESYSTRSTSPTRQPVITTIQETKSQTLKSVSSNSVVIKPAFIFSLFKNIPPTLNFVEEGEKAETLPWELRKLLKWKLSPITPIVVKTAIGRIGFRITKKNYEWMGCFGKHMKAQCFKQLRDFQKLNHFPGSFNIGRKDKLWRNLSRMQAHFGKKEFNFFPQTFVLPTDNKLLKRIWEEGSGKQKWIVKPPASARGQGIRVISKWSQVPRKRPVIVQKYIHSPYLINGSKFDMRIYVYVSSYDPLRLYVYNDGLARFASSKYSSSTKSLSNRFIHLTNYSVNKKNTQYVSNSNTGNCEGHKWSLKSLWDYLKQRGVNTTAVWNTIKDLIIKTIISGDSSINSTTKANLHSRYCCHELFGFDVLLDENCKPWILEVNISPSLHSNSKLDVDIKSGLIKDMMNIAGLRLPDARDTHPNSTSSEIDLGKYAPPNKFCMDKRLFTTQLSPDERAKHAYFCQKFQDELPYLSLLAVNKNSIVEAFVMKHHIEVMQSILDVLTPDDARHLCESIDEDSRKGNFQRLFPTPQTHNYLRYFEQPRYYNLLLDQWVLLYNHMEQKGISLLQSLCEENIHLENPTSNPKHQWSPPNSHIRSYEVKQTVSNSSLKSSSSTSMLPKIVKKKQVSKSDRISFASGSRASSLTSSSSSPQLHAYSSSLSSATPSR
ncbi:probable beta-tubulin polyglutamylase isoform X1 [Biomphalaria glabrata]|uniref:Probable beta-tubulin polyglutamylase isoform X1 n=1 Tax=Biomphalaria glabrata TaxID=6526 RepID=A0A9W2YG44_BIOGL|nr:probable beta-tubulin polyglutamylase isoform X1 [Biomphalaria glabrata]XP_055861683.1 probable beta-tubulin polyglutamylase isoform X1 [Biomphalaria glabrata]